MAYDRSGLVAHEDLSVRGRVRGAEVALRSRVDRRGCVADGAARMAQYTAHGTRTHIYCDACPHTSSRASQARQQPCRSLGGAEAAVLLPCVRHLHRGSEVAHAALLPRRLEDVHAARAAALRARRSAPGRRRRRLHSATRRDVRLQGPLPVLGGLQRAAEIHPRRNWPERGIEPALCVHTGQTTRVSGCAARKHLRVARRVLARRHATTVETAPRFLG